MRRRAFLAALTAAGAGCSGPGGGQRRGRGTFGVENTPEPGGGGSALVPVGYTQFEGTVAERPAADATVALSPAETGSRAGVGVRFLFEGDADASRPATLRATLVNRSDTETVVDTAGVPGFEPTPVYPMTGRDGGAGGGAGEDGSYGSDRTERGRTGTEPADATPTERGRTGTEPADATPTERAATTTRVDSATGSATAEPTSARGTMRRDGGDVPWFALAPTPDHPFAVTTPTIERGDDGRWRVGAVDAWLPEELVLSGLERRTGRYALVDVPGLAGLAPGRYRMGAGDLATTAYVWSRSAPGPSVASGFAGAGLPAVEGVETWFHGATERTRSWLAPAAERASVPGELRFELVNHHEHNLVGRLDRVQCYRLADGAWYPLSWGSTNDISEPVLPGQRVSWTVRLAGDGDLPAGSGPAFPFLGGGTYAFATDYGDGYAAAFDLEAPELSLEPTPGVATTREGDAVVVTHPEWPGADRGVTFVLEAATDSPSRRLVTEQAYRDPVLRNALAFAADAPVVRYRSPVIPDAGPFRWGFGGVAFRYEGAAYAVALAEA